MPPRLYLETTIPSYLAARPSLQTVLFTHQQLTALWWERRRQDFALVVSELVREECAAGDPQIAQRRLELLSGIPVLRPDRAMLEVARELVEHGPIPAKAAGDALHVATATVYGCEYLLTWNCRHIANAEIRRAAARVVARQGYDLPVICTPEELMGGEE
jgi:predicted nucleic acid-binding protein